MRTIKAFEFKAKCLKLMDEVAATGEPVVITKTASRWRSSAPSAATAEASEACTKGQIEILGDIIEPIDVEWDASR